MTLNTKCNLIFIEKLSKANAKYLIYIFKVLQNMFYFNQVVFCVSFCAYFHNFLAKKETKEKKLMCS